MSTETTHTRSVLAAMALLTTAAAAQTPLLRFDPPPNYMRSAIYPPEDYVSNQFNASFQIYPFEPFNGNVAEAFQRTLFSNRIDPRHREENVAGAPQFASARMPGAQAVYQATFSENRVGIVRPHLRILIVASGAVAIVDVATINSTMWARLAPDVNNMLRTMRVETAAAGPSVGEGPGPGGEQIAGLYRGIKQKYMTGLTFQHSYYTPASHFYLFSRTGQVYRAYDQIRAPGGDINRFDFDYAARADPPNSGRFTVAGDKLYIRIGQNPPIVVEAPRNNTVTIESVTYTRQ
ncbi:MAG TPA: hypothetical protein VGL53_12370 [Bryobacteraceae bacterium]|jgi:hypothetical protein